MTRGHVLALEEMLILLVAAADARIIGSDDRVVACFIAEPQKERNDIESGIIERKVTSEIALDFLGVLAVERFNRRVKKLRRVDMHAMRRGRMSDQVRRDTREARHRIAFGVMPEEHGAEVVEPSRNRPIVEQEAQRAGALLFCSGEKSNAMVREVARWLRRAQIGEAGACNAR